MGSDAIALNLSKELDSTESVFLKWCDAINSNSVFLTILTLSFLVVRKGHTYLKFDSHFPQKWCFNDSPSKLINIFFISS